MVARWLSSPGLTVFAERSPLLWQQDVRPPGLAGVYRGWRPGMMYHYKVC